MRKISLLALFLASLIALSSCRSFDPSKISFFSFKKCSSSYDSSYEGHYKVGVPYKINGRWYYPQEDPFYDKIGIASWYGQDFHCKKTANGQIFNKEEFTAAHKTLPLPSVAIVTNLSNGRATKVIINDRGPFAHDRIIDLSERTATALGMRRKGVSTVRVKFLQNETNRLLTKLALGNHIKHANLSYKRKLLPDDRRYSIILGAFKYKENALKAVRSISDVGHARIVELRKNGDQYYRVRLSSNTYTLQQARKLLARIVKLGHNKAIIIKS
jgi:peptidoglycan lytic transglycosylase